MNTEIRICEAKDMQEPQLDCVTSLINRVYAEAEAGMWKPGFKRVEKAEVANFIDKKQLIFAVKAEKIIGSVFVTVLESGRGEFGMLVCDPKERHQGIGRKLIAAAEKHCRRLGCQEMQLELLYPRDRPQETKEILKVWYPKLGYQQGPAEDFNAVYPQLAPLLATDCVFSTYIKLLT